MRVEFVSPYDHSPNTGIGRYVHTMTHHLSESIDVTTCRPRFLSLANRFSSLRNLPIGIEDHVSGSIVHFPQIMGCAMMLYRPYHPSVATVHDLGFLELPEEWEMFDPIARLMLRLSLVGLKRVDRIVTDSEFTRQGVIKHLGVPEDRVVAIHLGIDHDLFRPVPNAREILISHYSHLAAVASAPWLLYVGSELPRKNIGALLRAVALVRKEIPDIRLLKVGAAGGERFRQETIRIIAELSIEDRVLFFERVAEEELPLFYNAADVFVTASKLEGFGFPVLEAMACGTPVVCSRTASLPEIGGDIPLYSSPDDASSMSTKISASLAHFRDGIPSIISGTQRAADFRWAVSVAKLSTLYETLLTRE